MKVIDLIVVVLLGIGFLIGYYKGFVNTVANAASFVVAYLFALIFHGSLAGWILDSTSFGDSLLYYTAGAEKLSDMTIANVDVATVSVDRITEVITTSGLPKPIETQMQYNIINQVFLADGITTMSDYFNQTIINLTMSLICFLLIYFVVRIIVLFAIGLVDKVWGLPVLKQHDSLLGGCFGILQGAMIAFIIFSIVPIFMSVLPLDMIDDMIQESFLGRFFYNSNIIFNVLSGRI